MAAYIGRRILQAIPTVLLVVLITFTLGFYAPGDPIRAMYGDQVPVDDAARQALRHHYGLDRPYPIQFGDYLSKVLRGDFGRSISLSRPVGQAMGHALPISAQIGLAALLLLVVLGVPLGVLAAIRQNSVLDYGVLASSLLLASIPAFVLAPLVMILFVLQLGWFNAPIGWDGLMSGKAVLPVVILAVGPLPYVIRYTRAAMLEALQADFVRTARAKGLATRGVVVGHVLRNALPPIVTVLGLSVAGLITGAVFIENIFAIPGFGRLAVTGLQKYDYPLILGTTIVGALLVIGANLVVDLLYGFLDPRVRLGQGARRGQ
jgi:ABC-type dipeptide/oligopeptide/nickel transport system permease component